MKKILYRVSLILFLSACSNSSSSSGPEKKIVDTAGTRLAAEKKEASCKYSFVEGQSAPSSLSGQNIKTSLFGKEYDASLLNSVLKSSGAETRRFAELTGVTIYKISNLNTESLGCLFNESLSDAPRILSDVIRGHEAEMNKGKDEKSTIEGLYLDQEEVKKKLGSSYGASILVKTDTPRYTMVHEFMHHVFQLQKSKMGTEVKNELIEIANQYDAVSKVFNSKKLNDKTPDDLTNMTEKLELLSSKLIDVLKAFYLEEVSIESELNTKYQRGELQYVADYSRLNGDFYIVSSAEKAASMLDQISKEVSSLNDVYKDMSGYSYKESLPSEFKILISSKLKSIDTKARSLKVEAQLHARSALDRLKSKLRDRGMTMGIASSASAQHDVGCSHNQEVDQLLSSLKKRLDQARK